MRAARIRLATATLLAAAVGATLVLPARAQMDQDWSKITYKVHKLAPNLYMLEGQGGFAGGNIGVSVGDDGLLLVDTGFPMLADKLRAELKKLSPKPVKLVINTHHHGDHTMGNTGFGADGTIIAHVNARARLVKEGFWENTPAPPAALPLVLIRDRLDLHVNGEDIQATYLPPAHTDSDVMVKFAGSNVVHLGDVFFNGFYPFIDTRTGGSVKGYIAGVEKALADLPAGAKIIPGHGPPATRKELEAFLEMLKETSATVEKGIKAGKKLAELQAAKPFAKYDSWANGFLTSDKYLEMLYAGLGGK